MLYMYIYIDEYPNCLPGYLWSLINFQRSLYKGHRLEVVLLSLLTLWSIPHLRLNSYSIITDLVKICNFIFLNFGHADPFRIYIHHDKSNNIRKLFTIEQIKTMPRRSYCLYIVLNIYLWWSVKWSNIHLHKGKGSILIVQINLWIKFIFFPSWKLKTQDFILWLKSEIIFSSIETFSRKTLMIIDAYEICGTKGKKPRPDEDKHNLYVYLIYDR